MSSFSLPFRSRKAPIPALRTSFVTPSTAGMLSCPSLVDDETKSSTARTWRARLETYRSWLLQLAVMM